MRLLNKYWVSKNKDFISLYYRPLPPDGVLAAQELQAFGNQDKIVFGSAKQWQCLSSPQPFELRTAEFGNRNFMGRSDMLVGQSFIFDI